MGSRRQAVKIRRTGPSLGERARAALRVVWRPLVIWVLPTAVLITACWAGLRACRSYVAGAPGYHVVAPKIGTPDPRPDWWGMAEDQINAACASTLTDETSILDESVLERIAEGYGRCPWIKDVQWVRKQFPNRVEANLLVRWPAAAVRIETDAGFTYCLVGEDGVRLPKSYHDFDWPPPGLDVPYITGVAAPVPEPGEPWGEASVADAIAIVAGLRESEIIKEAVHITEVDVSNHGGRARPTESEFLVHAEGNCVIEWGRAPDTNRPGELTVRKKIEKLERYLADGNPIRNRTLGLRFAGRRVVRRRHAAHGDSG